jgi:hypothetical protein
MVGREIRRRLLAESTVLGCRVDSSITNSRESSAGEVFTCAIILRFGSLPGRANGRA